MSDITPEKNQPYAKPSPTPPDGLAVDVSETLRPPFRDQPAQPAAKRTWSKQMLGLAIIVLLLIVAASLLALGRRHQNNQQATAVTKKDIPLLRVQYQVSEVPQYPIRNSGYGVDANIALQMFEGLIQYQDQTKVVPLLAKNWSNPDHSTWIFNLRDDVKFHTGHKMTAADVKFTLDYLISQQNGDNGIVNLVDLSTIKEVDAISPYQVKIVTKQQDPLLLKRMNMVGIVDSKATLGDYNAGTGPYVVKPGTTPSKDSIDLVADPNYWGGHVYTREVQIKIDEDEDQIIKGIDDNKYDLAGSFGKAELAHYKQPYQRISVPDQGLNYLMLNTKRAGSPLQSIAGRQAVASALDVPDYIKQDEINGEPASQLVPESLPGHDPNIKAATYDLTKAKQLLATVKNATAPITIAYIEGADSEFEYWAKNLEAAGFNVKLVSISDADAYYKDAVNGKYDIIGLAYTSNYVDGLDILSFALTGTKNYDNPQVDSLLEQTTTTFDPSARIKLMQQVASIADKDKPVIPLYFHNRIFVLKPTNFVAIPDMPSFDNSVYYWKVYQK
jgi:peptide/nickel transport system substrate-binding protein